MASRRVVPIEHGHPQTTPPATFIDALLSRAARDDLAAFDEPSRTRAIADAYAHVSKPREPGRQLVALDHRLATIGGREHAVSVLAVVNDNMPFLLDSTLAVLAEQGISAHLVLHPILAVERDAKGALIHIAGDALIAAPAGTRRESLIHIHLERLDEAASGTLLEALDKTYADVRLSVGDWAAMRGRLAAAVMDYRQNPPPLPASETSEAIAFLDWIGADNFTFLGIREYRYPKGDTAADPVEGSGLGILRDSAVKVLRKGRDLVTVTPEVRAFLASPVALIITKANVKSRVHRRVHLDYVGVKLFSTDGRLEGELRIIGLFTASAYTSKTTEIPYLRHKITTVVASTGFDPASHSGRALMHVLEDYPRDELFQIEAKALESIAVSIMTLYERPRVRALPRVDQFDRFVSLLVYIPKDRYDSQVRRRVGDFLARLYQGRLSAAYPAYPEGPLARTHYIIGRDEGKTPEVDPHQVEAGIAAIVKTWPDSLKGSLALAHEGATARRLYDRYADAFSAAYRESFSAEQSLDDIAILETLSTENPRAVDLRRRDGTEPHRASLKLFARGNPMPLSERVPLLENFGFRVVNERTYRVIPAGSGEAERVWLHDMLLEEPSGATLDIPGIAERFEPALIALFSGETETDSYDGLVLRAGLAWREVALIRALSRYLMQARIPYSQDYMAGALKRNSVIAADLVALFKARFDPALKKDTAEKEPDITARIENALQNVSSLDDDRILRRFVNLIRAAIRTSYFQMKAGKTHPVIAFKFESRLIEDLPRPRPLYEIFMTSPRVEGVHLRFGKVARGGLRWSDRPQDFRTEILGLVKAQQVKNAVIVPVGAKGGFVPKRLPPISERAAWLEEGTQAYRIFIATLLDLTDNIVGGAIKPPPSVLRHDGDDPYLVVAADKGTATFSDTANAISLERGHWLGDAFASGGSVGYDHKKMGITARGAWEAVKRHFREMDHDIQTQAFTAAGVGDMSGDVFGNGMLLSKATRLVAAFDHRDIFLDPDPDPAASFAERERLFNLPRSSWQDYDKSLVSEGGGIFSRSLKSIPLSPQIRAVLGFDKAEASPQEVMSAILKAPVDLLWFGGIGTYIRSSQETDDAAGDRANDAIRITGRDLRAKVLGEGANLGATQLGRIEAAANGVRLNTDAIDNSAGVNTSDVEVNIKIGLSTPVADGRLSKDARENFLAGMTQEVAGLVLRNNYLQTLALSLSERRGPEDLPFVRRLMQMLEQEGRLDRAVEYLPSDAALLEREMKGQGLTRPELAVLLAYAKLALHDQLLTSTVPDDAYLAGELTRYFPAAMRKTYPDAIETHRLRREIVATQLANAIINRGGPTLIARLMDRTGANAVAIAHAYALTRDALGLLDLNTAIDGLDTHVSGQVQLALYAEVQDVLMSRMVWFLQHVDTRAGLQSPVKRFRDGREAVVGAIETILAPSQAARRRSRIAALVADGIEQDLATRIADLPILTLVPDAVLVAETSGVPVAAAAASLFALTERLNIGRITTAAATLKLNDHYERLAVERASDGVDIALRRLASSIAKSHGHGPEGVDAWIGQNAEAVQRLGRAVTEILSSGLSQAKLTVVSGLLNDLAPN